MAIPKPLTERWDQWLNNGEEGVYVRFLSLCGCVMFVCTRIRIHLETEEIYKSMSCHGCICINTVVAKSSRRILVYLFLRLCSVSVSRC